MRKNYFWVIYVLLLLVIAALIGLNVQQNNVIQGLEEELAAVEVFEYEDVVADFDELLHYALVDYQASGGSMTFENWVRRYHTDLWLRITKYH